MSGSADREPRFDFTRALRRLFTGARTGGGSSRCNRPGRTMKRTLAATLASAAALTATGLAVARNLDSSTNVRAVAGTFAATTASRVDTKTCTTTDGKTLVTTTGTYTGASTGDADLTGTATLHARSTINTTDNVGVVSGSLKIDVASGRDTQADFSAVYSGGSLAGLGVGRGHDPAAPLVANLSAGFTAAGRFTSGKVGRGTTPRAGRGHGPAARLVANLSAGFTAAGGFTSGKIGGGTTAGAAVELGPGRCQTVKTVQQRSQARGTVSAVSPTSITVAGLTCTVPANLQTRVAKLAVNDRAEIHCTLVNGANTLNSVEGKH